MDKMKKWKYGSYAFLMTAVVLGIFIVISMLIRNIDWKIDMTQNKIYSLEKQTTDVLKNLKENVNIYVFYMKGREDERVKRLLDTYKKHSAKVKIEYIDVLKNPDKVKKYTDVYLNYNYDPNPVSVVFETPKRIKVVNHFDMVGAANGQEEFQGENKFTNAIRFVSVEKVPSIYYLLGHREPSLDKFALQSELLKKENYNINTLDLLTQKKIPDDADMILDVSPQTDFLPEEITEIRKYMDNGGKGAFFIDPPVTGKQDISKLKNLLKEWGIEILDNIAVEGSQNRYYQNPVWTVPEIQSYSITDPIRSAGLNILMPYSRCLKAANNNGYTAVSLMKTSSNSWGKTEIKENKLNKAQNDLAGPLDLAAASSKEIKDKTGKKTGDAKIFAAGTSGVINERILENPGNYDFFLNIFGWMKGETEEITIRPKPTLYVPLKMNNTQRVVTILFVLIFIPLAILITGLIVWTRRKHL